MKAAVLFVAVLYVSLPAIIAMPLLLGRTIELIFVFFLIFGFAVFAAVTALYVLGILLIIRTGKSDFNNSKKTWIVSKLAPVPVYVLNFIILFSLSPVMLFPASVFIVPISGFITCSAIVLSGISGILCIKKMNPADDVSRIHLVLQVIPVLDVIDTLFILIKKKNS